jgi:peptidoglycan L-alanyl-D-glutamate endopeptidase CwlK
MPSRKISDLTLEMQALAKEFAKMLVLNGIEYMITSTYRSQEEQDALYAQGRTTPGRKVTWTQHSRHTDREALDIAILKGGEIVWDPKVDVDMDRVPDYLEAGIIGEQCGLVWGGRWKTSPPDFPHCELPRKA